MKFILIVIFFIATVLNLSCRLFLCSQIYKMESEEGTKPSQVDRIFKQALREFKDNLVATYSVVNKQGVEVLNIKYKDLIANFLHVSIILYLYFIFGAADFSRSHLQIKLKGDFSKNASSQKKNFADEFPKKKKKVT